MSSQKSCLQKSPLEKCLAPPIKPTILISCDQKFYIKVSIFKRNKNTKDQNTHRENANNQGDFMISPRRKQANCLSIVKRRHNHEVVSLARQQVKVLATQTENLSSIPMTRALSLSTMCAQ